MSFIGEKLTVVLNSRNRLTGTHSDFTISIPHLGDKKKFENVCLLECVIPKSYYLIADGSNFILEENGNQATITVPKGSYSRNSFRAKLESLLNSGSPLGWTYTISYPAVNSNPDTGKFTYAVSGNSGGLVRFIIADYLYEPMGFEANSINSFTSTIESTNVVKLIKEDAILVLSDVSEEADGNAVLGVVFGQTDVSYSSIYKMNGNVEAYSKHIRDPNKNVIRIQITNEDSNVIDLNGQNVVLMLLFWNPIPLYKRANGYINYLLSKDFDNLS